MQRMRQLLLFWFAMNACTAWTQSNANVAPDVPLTNGAYRIAGIVLNAKTGAPVSAARLYLANVRNRREIKTALTSEDGHFEFLVDQGKFSLEAAHKGFLRSAFNQHEQFSTAIVTGAGIDATDLKIQLAPEAEISGNVLDENGDPVRHATVTLYAETHNSGISRVVAAATEETDDQGWYEFVGVRPGTYFLSAHASPWYAVHPMSDAEGNPSAVSVNRALDVAYPTIFYSDVTDSDEATPFPVRGGDQVSIDFHLYPVQAVHLRMHGSAQSPTGGVPPPMFFSQRVFDGSQRVDASVQGSADGTFEIAGLLPGRYALISPARSGVASETEIDIQNDSTDVIPLPPQEVPANVKVKLNLTGATKTGSRYFVLLVRQRRATANQELDGKGEASFESVAPNTYDVVIASDSSAISVISIQANGTRTPGNSLAVSPGAEMDVSITAISSQAKVEGVARKGDKPFAGAMIVLIPDHPATHKELFRRDQSDLDGSFSLPGVIPGKYTLVAIEDGWDLDWARPEVIAAYARHGVRITVNGDLEVRDPISITPR